MLSSRLYITCNLSMLSACLDPQGTSACKGPCVIEFVTQNEVRHVSCPSWQVLIIVVLIPAEFALNDCPQSAICWNCDGDLRTSFLKHPPTINCTDGLYAVMIVPDKFGTCAFLHRLIHKYTCTYAVQTCCVFRINPDLDVYKTLWR